MLAQARRHRRSVGEQGRKDGPVRGDEIPQLYLTAPDPVSQQAQFADRSLVAFTRIALDPRQSKRVRLHLPPLTVLATLFQFASVLLMAGAGGNLLSILIPYRIQPGSMKPTKMPGLVMFALMFCQMLFPVAMVPVFAGPRPALTLDPTAGQSDPAAFDRLSGLPDGGAWCFNGNQW